MLILKACASVKKLMGDSVNGGPGCASLNNLQYFYRSWLFLCGWGKGEENEKIKPNYSDAPIFLQHFKTLTGSFFQWNEHRTP